MDRFFGKKKETKSQPQPQQTQAKPKFNMDQRLVEMDQKEEQLDTKMKTLEADIRIHYEKLKRTNLTSEKTYLKNRLKNLLMKRKQIESQLSRLNNQKMMMDKVSFNQQNIQDTIEMGNHMRELNKVQKEQLEQMDFDQIQDTFEEMEELAWENDRINDMMNQNFDVDVDEDLDEELENLENELEVQDMMNRQKNMNSNAKYDPLKN